MNVNSDDDAQTRATSSTAIACARSRHPARRTPPGTRARRNPASRHASQLAAGYSSRSSAAAAFGAIALLGEAAHRLPQRLVLLREIEHPTASRYIVGWRRSSGNEPLARPRGATRRSRRRSRRPCAQQRLREPRRRSRAGGGSRARPRARARSRACSNSRIGAAVVTEHAPSRASTSWITGARPNSAGALARDLGDHGDDVVDVLVLARARSRSATCSASVYA